MSDDMTITPHSMIFNKVYWSVRYSSNTYSVWTDTSWT